MEINCIICSDLFTPNSDISINQCGHIFHSACLFQWLERSPTCPQCRRKATHKTTYKVYFNFLNVDSGQNIGMLQENLDSVQLEIQQKEKSYNELLTKYDSSKAENLQLKEIKTELEREKITLESTLSALKMQQGFLKTRAKEADKLEKDIRDLRTQMRDMENVRTVINGTRNEVIEILRNETNMEALALLSATLKKTLLESERKNSVMQTQLKHTQNDLVKYKRKFNHLEGICAELRKELDCSKKSWDEEKEYLRNKIAELTTKSESTGQRDTSVMRIMTESPAPLPRRRLELSDKPVTIDSPTVSETVINLTESDSPYLSVKTNYGPMLDGNYNMKISKKKSIFKTLPETSKVPNTNMVYTGLGGQVKEDSLKFPVRKPETGLKRPKSSSSSIPSHKFRKLAPVKSSKITDYLLID